MCITAMIYLRRCVAKKTEIETATGTFHAASWVVWAASKLREETGLTHLRRWAGPPTQNNLGECQTRAHCSLATRGGSDSCRQQVVSKAEHDCLTTIPIAAESSLPYLPTRSRQTCQSLFPFLYMCCFTQHAKLLTIRVPSYKFVKKSSM